MTLPQVFVLIGVIVVCYFIGNINFALIISKLKNRNIYNEGSGNPGTMNMIRNFGKKMGAVTLFLDILKGAVPAVLGWFFIGGLSFGTANFSGILLSFDTARFGLFIGGTAAVVGHVFPVFLKFKGGKGIGSSIGVCFVIQPILALICGLSGVAFIILTKLGSIGSFIIIYIPFAVEALRMGSAAKDYKILVGCILLFFIFALTLFAHRKNIVKLFKGTESKTVIIKRREKR